MKAAQWIIDKNPILLGADNWPVEVAPNPDPTLSLPIHQLALVVNGVHLLENMKLDELAQKQVYEFAFMMQPLKIQGGTGSTVSPTVRGEVRSFFFPLSPQAGRGWRTAQR